MPIRVLIGRAGKIVEIDAKPTHTIGEIKALIIAQEMLSPAVGPPAEHLLADNLELANDGLTLADYGICPDSQLEFAHYSRPERPIAPRPLLFGVSLVPLHI